MPQEPSQGTEAPAAAVSAGEKASTEVLGVLLAGGANRRYAGEPKALETVAGETIAARAIRALRGASDRVVTVANDAATFAALGLEIRPDERQGQGALGGIHTAVRWADDVGARGALVVACDMPFVPAELLLALLSETDDADVVAPTSRSRRGLEPLCAFYTTRCQKPIETALDRGDRRVISFFPDVRVHAMPLERVRRFGDPDVLFLNVNTPEERQRADELARAAENSRS